MLTKSITACFIFTFALYFQLLSQTTVQGTIMDRETGESIVGAHIVLKFTSMGVLSDSDGKFKFVFLLNPPFSLSISAVGYQSQELKIEDAFKQVEIGLMPKSDSSLGIGVVARAHKVEDVVVSASKLEELKLEAPATTLKLGLLSIREIPNADVYSGLAALPEVQMNPSSLSFVSLNTRGFADVQNWRFVQLVDGVDVVAPGLNYAIGNISGSSDLDLSHIELVAGPGSALYGPNVFNGVLVMNTKSPFDHLGVSAYIKSGLSVQKVGGANPYGDFGVRVAQVINDRIAVKLNVAFMTAKDWEADDQSYYISNTNLAIKDELLARPRNDPNFDAVSVYGDEIQVPVDLKGDGTFMTINRTGIPERDLIDYDINNFKLGVAVHYRMKKNLEAIYDYKLVQADAILRHTTTYPFRGIRHQIQKLELRSPQFYVRAYHSLENANNSYAMLATGAFIQEGLKSSKQWSADYGASFRGEVPGISAGDHDAARAFADRDIPNADSEVFQQLKELTLNNPDIRTGGSKFIDRSSFFHLDGNYDFSKLFSLVDIQAGGSFRRYSLNSEGQLFNDGPLGFANKIPINEYGTYIQATKKLLADRMSIRASARYDKNQNFKGRITPRASVVLSLGKNREHNFRFTAQTGFRNPASQETYIALDLGEAIILGGTEDNISNYNYDLGGGNLINGLEIYEGLLTIPSVQAFLASGGTDPSLLQAANLSFLRQENITTFELGYKTAIAKQLHLGFSLFRNYYTDFVSRIVAYSLQADRPFAIYTNIPDRISSTGATVDLAYHLPKGFRLKANYSKLNYNASQAVENNPGFLPSFNTPNNRFNASLANRNIAKGVGFVLSFRWSDSYIWQSPYGQGEIDAYTQLDGAISMQIPSLKSTVKLGGSNLLRQEYRPIYGGPYIGSIYYLSLNVDNLSFKGK